jgi:flagellar biosynthetic protein FlhB
MAENNTPPSKEDKTEDATEQRIRKAQEKGDFPISKDLTTTVMLVGSMVSLFLVFPFLSKGLTLKLRGILEQAHLFYFHENNPSILSWILLSDIMPDFLIMMIVFIICAVAATYIQTRLTLNTSALEPKLEKISIIKGFKRLFSAKSLVELIKSLIKLIIIATLIYVLLKDELKQMPEISSQPVIASLYLFWKLSFKLFMVALVFQTGIAGADYMYQRYEYFKRLKMTKQELKEEYKDTEGDPHIKSRRRQIHRNTAKGRMLEKVQDATVVITNPTHYAVALKYKPLENKAPIVIAKGKDRIALTIRELALKHWIHIIENPPLARSLYKIPLNKEIPPDFYKAVAEIIKYVFKKKNQRV